MTIEIANAGQYGKLALITKRAATAAAKPPISATREVDDARRPIDQDDANGHDRAVGRAVDKSGEDDLFRDFEREHRVSRRGRRPATCRACRRGREPIRRSGSDPSP